MERLSADLVHQAIDIFLREAYPSGKTPSNRKHFQERTGSEPLDALFALPGIEKLPNQIPGQPDGYALRIGCEWYPHLKMTIKPCDAEPGFVFGVDTHDTFDLPPDNPEAEAVKQLQARNRNLAKKIDGSWESFGLPTERGLLKRYLKKAEQARSRQADRSKE